MAKLVFYSGDGASEYKVKTVEGCQVELFEIKKHPDLLRAKVACGEDVVEYIFLKDNLYYIEN